MESCGPGALAAHVLQGAAHPQALIGAAVDELEELDGELDVP